MPSYEVVLDNSKLLSNCSEENPESGVVLSTQVNAEPSYIISRPFAVWFKAPDDFTPEFFSYKMRASTISGTPSHNYMLWSRFSSADNSVEYMEDAIGLAADPSPTGFDLLVEVDGVPDDTWIAGFWQNQVFDLTPSDSFGWFDLSTGDPGIISDLMGDGVRIDIGLTQEEDLDYSVHETARVYQFHLLLSGSYSGGPTQTIEVDPYLEGPGFISAAFVIEAPPWFGSSPRLV